MIKEKLKSIFLYCLISVVVAISILYFCYYMYYEGYIASDINTCDSINYSVKEILFSENTQEKKKALIEKLCLYTYAEITIKKLSDDTIFYKKESWIKNKKLFKSFVLSVRTIKIKDEYYSIKYKIYIPKFYTAIRYCIFLGKHMTIV